MIARVLIPVVAVLCLFPFMPPAGALLAGVTIVLLWGNPYPTKAFTHRLLSTSIIGLGAGMNLETVARVGFQGLGFTIVSIGFVFAMGWLLRKALRVEDEVGILITVGTAICGGSAIAAVTPVLRAKAHSVSVALGIVFILNALALVVFPEVGHALQLGERQFGLWSALAIHDTSSVVGATVAYGKVAAEVGTTVKLARALWIVPVTLAIAALRSRKGDTNVGGIKKPWFILGFLLMAGLMTWVPALQPFGSVIEMAAKRLLVLTLFFIGLGLSRETLRQVGPRPLLMGVLLWIVTAISMLAAVQIGWISSTMS